jgi:DHA1 family tetracycline resistance protein-like MFS transporter
MNSSLRKAGPRGSPRLATIFLIVFVDLLGFSLILPLLPYYAESFGASAALVGLLVATYAAGQFIGAPILGRLSDRIGRRPVLLVSIAGTLIGFLLLAFAPALGEAMALRLGLASSAGLVLALLFLSRLIDGLTGGNISVAQAYIADITDESNRARGMGIIGAAFGLGFIMGPALGGALASFGYAAPALLAAILSAINLVLVYFLLPESLSPQRRAELASRPTAPFSLAALRRALRRPRLGPLLHVRLFFGLGFAMFQTIFALYAASHLRLSVQTTGFVLAYVGVLAVFVQAVGVPWLSRRVPEGRLITVALAAMTVSLLAWAVTPSLAALVLILTPLAMSGGLLNTVITSALSKAVEPEEVGGTLGLAAALESLSRIVAPIVGAWLLQDVGAWAPGVACALLLGWTTLFALRRIPAGVLPGASRLDVVENAALAPVAD